MVLNTANNLEGKKTYEKKLIPCCSCPSCILDKPLLQPDEDYTDQACDIQLNRYYLQAEKISLEKIKLWIR